ncbi:MAG TPA: hypothetical protein VF911_16635 [Thermoanaerobaculia bacterium]
MRTSALIATSALAALVLALFFTQLELTRADERPRDVQELARRIARRPADWLAACALSDRSLDSDLPRRRELWRAGYAHAELLAPRRPNTAAGFVRAGLFHWHELTPAERKAVLDTAATLMDQPGVFERMYQPLWQLTRDLAYLRRVAPRNAHSFSILRDLAAMNGLFADYRALRAESRAARLQAFSRERKQLAAAELLMYVPDRLDAAEAPLVRGILDELNERAFDPQQLPGHIDSIALFAIEHNLQPLAALSPFIETPNVMRDVTRARLALALGDRTAASRIELTTAVVGAKEWIPYYEARAEYEARHGDAALAKTYRDRAAFTARGQTSAWAGLCDADLCLSATREHEGPLAVTLTVVQSDEVPLYVEIYVDGVLMAEGEVRDVRTFAPAVGAGMHRTEVRLVNPRTRNGIQRRARLS